jgi:ABC-type nitrate/sulfonate/bicarbonate transport system substrate-binding protein
MPIDMKRVTIAPKGMGLNDFVAFEEGFFAAEGLDVELDWKTSTISSGRRTSPMPRART